MASELAWVVKVPVPCGNCGKESLQVVAWLIKQTEIVCPTCGAILDIETKEWTAFRNALREFHVRKEAPVAPIKKGS